MSTMASQIKSSTSLAFVWEIHRWPVNFPHKGPVTRKMFPFDDVIMMIEMIQILIQCDRKCLCLCFINSQYATLN